MTRIANTRIILTLEVTVVVVAGVANKGVDKCVAVVILVVLLRMMLLLLLLVVHVVVGIVLVRART